LSRSRGNAELDDPVSEGEVLDVFRDILSLSSTTDRTKEYILTALIKCSTRFTSTKDRIASLIGQFRKSVKVEIQQRACEFSALLAIDSIRGAVLEPMPVPEKPVIEEPPMAGVKKASAAAAGDDAAQDRRAPQSQQQQSAAAAKQPSSSASAPAAAAPKQPAAASAMDLLGLGDALPSSSAPQGQGQQVLDLLGGFGTGPSPSAGAATQSAPKPLNDASMLLDLLGSGPSAPPPAAASAPFYQQQQQQQQHQQPASTGALLDLLGGGPVAPPAAPPAAAPSSSGSIASFTPFNNGVVSLHLDCFKPHPHDPTVTTVHITFTNHTSAPLQNLTFATAVLKNYPTPALNPLSSRTIPPMGKVTQTITVTNPFIAEKSMVMRVQIEFDDAQGTHATE
jgi:AP-1 complex subunit gamma-1